MTDGKTPDGEKTLHAAGGGRTLSVKRPETGVVRQAFSHGRSKAVVVEKKRPTVARPGAKAEPVKEVAKPVEAAAPVPSKPAKAPPVQPKSGGMVLRTLTEGEKEARSRALSDARVAEDEERRRAQEEAKRRAEEDARLAKEREAAAKRKAEEDSRRTVDDDTRRRTDAPEERSAAPRPSARPSGPSARPGSSPRPGGAAPAARGPGGAPSTRPPAGAPGAGAPARRGPMEEDDGRRRRTTGPGGPGPGAPGMRRSPYAGGRSAPRVVALVACGHPSLPTCRHRDVSPNEARDTKRRGLRGYRRLDRQSMGPAGPLTRRNRRARDGGGHHDPSARR